MKKLFCTMAMVVVVAAPALAGKPDPQKRLERLTQELNLDASQQEEVELIMQQQKRQHDALREQYDPQDEQFRIQMRALRQRGAGDIEAVLNSEQQTAFNEMRKQHRAKRAKVSGSGKGRIDEASGQ